MHRASAACDPIGQRAHERRQQRACRGEPGPPLPAPLDDSRADGDAGFEHARARVPCGGRTPPVASDRGDGSGIDDDAASTRLRAARRPPPRAACERRRRPRSSSWARRNDQRARGRVRLAAPIGRHGLTVPRLAPCGARVRLPRAAAAAPARAHARGAQRRARAIASAPRPAGASASTRSAARARAAAASAPAASSREHGRQGARGRAPDRQPRRARADARCGRSACASGSPRVGRSDRRSARAGPPRRACPTRPATRTCVRHRTRRSSKIARVDTSAIGGLDRAAALVRSAPLPQQRARQRRVAPRCDARESPRCRPAARARSTASASARRPASVAGGACQTRASSKLAALRQPLADGAAALRRTRGRASAARPRSSSSRPEQHANPRGSSGDCGGAVERGRASREAAGSAAAWRPARGTGVPRPARHCVRRTSRQSGEASARRARRRRPPYAATRLAYDHGRATRQGRARSCEHVSSTCGRGDAAAARSERARGRHVPADAATRRSAAASDRADAVERRSQAQVAGRRRSARYPRRRASAARPRAMRRTCAALRSPVVPRPSAAPRRGRGRAPPSAPPQLRQLPHARLRRRRTIRVDATPASAPSCSPVTRVAGPCAMLVVRQVAIVKQSRHARSMCKTRARAANRAEIARARAESVAVSSI